MDPLTASYPWYTPYQFAGNKPIKFIDLDGLEEFDYLFLFRTAPRPTQRQNNHRRLRAGRSTSTPTGPTVTIPRNDPWARQRVLYMFPDANIIEEPESVLEKNLRIEMPGNQTRFRETGFTEQEMKNFSDGILNGFERVTTDPSQLDEDYFRAVRDRLANGTASPQDFVYASAAYDSGSTGVTDVTMTSKSVNNIRIGMNLEQFELMLEKDGFEKKTLSSGNVTISTFTKEGASFTTRSIPNKKSGQVINTADFRKDSSGKVDLKIRLKNRVGLNRG